MRGNRAMEDMRLLASLHIPPVNLRILAMQSSARSPATMPHQPKAMKAHTMGTPWEIVEAGVATWSESLGR